MKKIKLISWLIFILISFEMQGQRNSDYRVSVLYHSDDSVLRRAIVDSIVDESFWNTDASCMRWYRNDFRKTDFSEQSKEKLLSYFNRSLNDFEIQKVIDDAKKTMTFDIEKIRKESEQKGISYDSLYTVKLNELVNRNTKIVSVYAKDRVSPYYARLLGWLDYKPAIPVLEAIIADSLVNNKGYAASNKEEFETSCKLALARMGNKQYHNELLGKYKKTEVSCNDLEYPVFLENLCYINSRECIDFVIKLSEDDKIQKQPYMYGLFHECSPRDIILIYLARVIVDYPIKHRDPEIDNRVDINFFMFDGYYSNQFDKLSSWLKENNESYKINTEIFFMAGEY